MVIRTTLVGLVRHFALELDLLKTKSYNVDVGDELLPEVELKSRTSRSG